MNSNKSIWIESVSERRLDWDTRARCILRFCLCMCLFAVSFVIWCVRLGIYDCQFYASTYRSYRQIYLYDNKTIEVVTMCLSPLPKESILNKYLPIEKQTNQLFISNNHIVRCKSVVVT